MGRKKKKHSHKSREKSKSRRTKHSTASPAQLVEEQQKSSDTTQKAHKADEMQVQWASDQTRVLSSADHTPVASTPNIERTTTAVHTAQGVASPAEATASTPPFPRTRELSRKASKSSRISRASKTSKASKSSTHGVSWGKVQMEDARTPVDRVTPPSHWSEVGAGLEDAESDQHAKEIDEAVERRLVTMFKRQLKGFLLPPKIRQGILYPLDDEEQRILDGMPIRQERSVPWMIHPKTTFRNAWDLCMVVMSFASVILVPLNIAYFERAQQERFEWRIFNIASDMLFFVDVIFNFRTGIAMKEEHGRINMDPDYVAAQYRRGCFYVDSFCCLPLDYTAMVALHTGDGAADPSTTSAYPSILRVNKLLALPKIGRLTTVIRNIAGVEENFFVYSKGAYVRLLFNLGMLFLLIHWHGCLQFYVDRLEGFPTKSWVARLSLANASWPVQYSWSVYGSTSMMLGVGMGATEADSMTDSWLRCGCMATGHALQALLVGACIDMIMSMNFTYLRNRQRIRDLDDYMQYKMLPINLGRRIRDYAENRFKGLVFDENQIIKSLSDPLRERVMWHNCRRVLRNVPFFARAEPEFLRDLVASMKLEFFTPDDVVAAAGTMGDRLYLLQSGSARVVDAMGITVATVLPGDRFGEVCLLREMLRLRTVIADRYCHFFSLTRAAFNEVLGRHPDVKKIVDEIAAEHCEHRTATSAEEELATS